MADEMAEENNWLFKNALTLPRSDAGREYGKALNRAHVEGGCTKLHSK